MMNLINYFNWLLFYDIYGNIIKWKILLGASGVAWLAHEIIWWKIIIHMFFDFIIIFTIIFFIFIFFLKWQDFTIVIGDVRVGTVVPAVQSKVPPHLLAEFPLRRCCSLRFQPQVMCKIPIIGHRSWTLHMGMYLSTVTNNGDFAHHLWLES